MSRLESKELKLQAGGRQVEYDASVFASLIMEAATNNPKEFELPYTLTVPIAFPGDSKGQTFCQRISFFF